MAPQRLIWLFDLDDTLHHASHAVFPYLDQSMTAYIADHLSLSWEDADRLRQAYWRRYGATLVGLVRHHGVNPHDFLLKTHALTGLEARLQAMPRIRHLLRRLPGQKILVTNAPRAYAARVLSHAKLQRCFTDCVCIEDMVRHGQWRPKPHPLIWHRIRQRTRAKASRLCLVEDTHGHLRAVHRLGWRTVWVRLFRSSATPVRQGAGRRHGVDVTLRQPRELLTMGGRRAYL